LLKNQEYLIAEIEEREESPECLLTNPYKIENISYFDHSNVDYHNIPNPNALFIDEQVEHEKDKNGEQVISTQSNYILLEKFPKYTNQNQVYFRADDILTLADPSHSVLEYYQKTVDQA
jgi:spore coat polysaccharide biosynthesis protein SpsF (cytidylyltransferase family)